MFILGDKIFFPDPELATNEGLLAIGGDLSTQRLLNAYQNGIFPWYSKGDPVLWWSPDPRCVLFPEKLKVSKSMKQLLKKNTFEVTVNKEFNRVVGHCSTVNRQGQRGTWITEEMKNAYKSLHEQGYAHSVEVWRDKNLIGGLYGVAVGSCFCGESMFSLESNASKYGFVKFVQLLQKMEFDLIDCQVASEHLLSLGAEEIPRKKFLQFLKACVLQKNDSDKWKNIENHFD